MVAAQEEDKSPEAKLKKAKKDVEFTKNENFDLKPYYLDKTKVQSRLFGEIQSDKSKDIDWTNLEKLTKEAIGKADLPSQRLISLCNVLENELVRLQKLDEKYERELNKVSHFRLAIFVFLTTYKSP